MKVLHLKDHKCLLSQNKQVRNNFFRYRQYWELAKHIKPFQKNIKVNGRQCPDCM